jgi:transcriptional antiterminator RfaH
VNDRPWRVLHVASNHEKQVGLHLESRLVEYYLPLYQKISRWTDRSVTLHRPLFPGYVFVQIASENKIMVLSVPGVLRLLGNEYTGSVPAEEIERIRQGLSGNYNIQPHQPVVKGMRVRVCRGIFAGVEGIITELRRRTNVVLSLTSVNKYFSVETAIDNIDVLDENVLLGNRMMSRACD